MNQSGNLRWQLQQALLSAFPTHAMLAQMVSFKLDENLNAIAGGDNLSAITFNLIEWATSRERLGELVTKAVEANPGNAFLRDTAGQVQQALQANRGNTAALPFDTMYGAGSQAGKGGRLRQWVAGYWRPVVSLVALALAALNGLAFFVEGVPGAATGTAGRAWVIGLSLGALVLVRIPRVASLIDKLVGGSGVVPTVNQRKLFRGLFPYGRQDRIPGRNADIEECARLIDENSFFILEGETGCGKTSILNAALLPAADVKFHVCECRIATDPFGKLYCALLRRPYEKALGDEARTALAEAIATAPRPEGKSLLISIDQFEELFVTVKDDVRVSFVRTLKDAVAAGRARLVLTLRSDFLDLLMKVCHAVDPEQETLNMGNYYPLSAFREQQAIEVMEEILAPLADGDPQRAQVIEEFAKELTGELLRPPRDPRLSREDHWTVLPVELQTVGMMIEYSGVENFSVEALDRLGGKAGLLRAFIEDTKVHVWRRTGVQGETTLLILQELISPAGTKWPRTANDIGASLSLGTVSVATVERTLNALAEKFIVKVLPAESVRAGEEWPRYELLHEHLVEILSQAPDPFLQKARDAKERLAFWMRRTRTLFSPGAGQPPKGLLSTVRTYLAQPIPLFESLRLWKFATGEEFHRMLWKNLRGFGLRLALLVLPLALSLGVWFVWSRSGTRQVRYVVAEAPLDEIDLADESNRPLIEDWVTSLVYVGRGPEAFAALDRVKDESERSRLLAVVAKRFVLLRDTNSATVALDKSFQPPEFSWGDEHGVATSALAESLAKADKGGEIITLCEKIKGDENRARALATTAFSFFDAGRETEARETLNRALAQTEKVADGQRRVDMLNLIAEQASKKNRKDEALLVLRKAVASASSSDNLKGTDKALLHSAEQFAVLGDVEGARDAFGKFMGRELSGWAGGYTGGDTESVAKVAALLAGRGLAGDVTSLLRSAPTTFARQYLTTGSALGLLRANRVEEGLALLNGLAPSDDKVLIYCAAAQELLKAGREREAKLLLETDLTPSLEAARRGSPLGDPPATMFTEKLLSVGDVDRAVDIAKKWLSKSQRNAFGRRENHFVGFIASLAKKGHEDTALELARGMDNGPDRGYALTRIAGVMIEKGKPDEAAPVFTEGLALVGGGGKEDDDDFSPSLPNIYNAARYVLITPLAKAGKFKEALTLAHELKQASIRNDLLGDIHQELLKQGRADEAVADAKGFTDRGQRSQALASLASALADAGDGVRAQSLIDDIEFPDDKSRAFAAVAKWQARTGSLLPARVTARDHCKAVDRLGAYAVILSRYAEAWSPELKPHIEKDKIGGKKDEGEVKIDEE